MPDLGLLNNAVLNTWGEKLPVTVGNMRYKLMGVFVEAYERSPIGNTDIERPDPAFLFKRSDFDPLNITVNSVIAYDGIDFTIISDPVYETGDWCSVAVRVY
jgi:hypothetical protein